MRFRRNRQRPGLTDEQRAEARAAAEASLARARADHAREARALGREQPLIESLRQIRAANHFTEILTAAFRGTDDPA